jgi:hypothetical protein
LGFISREAATQDDSAAVVVPAAPWRLKALSVLDELGNREADVFGDLPKQNRRDVSTLVKRHGRAMAGAVSILLVRTALSDFGEAELEQNGDDLGGLQNRNITHDLCNCDVVDADEFRLKLRFAVLEEHGNHLLEVFVQLVERLALRVSTRKSRNKADEQTSMRITLDYCGERPHGVFRGIGGLIIGLAKVQCN